MSGKATETIRIVSIAFNARGVGFAVLDGSFLLDWGSIKAESNSKMTFLERTLRQIAWYEPTLVVFEDIRGNQRRSKCSLELEVKLCKRLEAVGITVSHTEIDEARRTLNRFGHDIAFKTDFIPVLVDYFPQLEVSAPPRRKTWNGEDYRMAIFVALALALHNLDRLT